MVFHLNSRLLVFIFLLPSISGCASLSQKIAEKTELPAMEKPIVVSALPKSFTNKNVVQSYRPTGWWRDFEDPSLDQLLYRTLSSNLDLAVLAARLKAFQAQIRGTRSTQSPQANINIGGNYSNSPIAGSGFAAAGAEQSNRLEFEGYTSSLGLSYELDIWKRLENLTNAAEADAYAGAADIDAARLTVMAETITAYFELVDTRAQIGLLEKSVELIQDRTTLTETRYLQGLVSSFELYQIKQEVRNIKAQLPQRRSRQADLEGRLAILSGGYLNELESLLSSELRPKLAFDDIATGLPISLLNQRPDIYAAAQRTEAARLKAGAQRADMLPRVNFSSGLGTQSGSIPGVFNILDNWVIGLGAGLTAPLFQGGQIKANIDVADAQYQETLANYASTVVNAYQEVNTALVGYETQRQRYKLLLGQLQEAKLSTDVQAQRQARGLGSYFDYLDVLIEQYRIEATLSTAGKDVALARLAVHRALGGDWINNAPSENLMAVSSGDL